MTVKELIEKLKNYDEDLKVHVFVGSGWDLDSQEAENIIIDKFDDCLYIE